MVDTNNSNAGFARRALGVFGYSRRALSLVWLTSRPLTVTLALLTIIGGILPAVIAYIGQLIVDGVVAATQASTPDTRAILILVGLEAIVVIAVAATQRGISASQSLLRALLGQRVNVMILEKAMTLELSHFEDSEFYDKLTQARREASSRPLSLVNRTFGLVQNLVIHLLALGRCDPSSRRFTVLFCRSQVLWRCVPAFPLALARYAYANISRNCHRA
jgi:ATP-binding cassette subfamily B protein